MKIAELYIKEEASSKEEASGKEEASSKEEALDKEEVSTPRRQLAHMCPHDHSLSTHP